MYPAGKHPLYPYTEEDKREILGELGLNESHIQSDVDTILDWFQKQPHLTEAVIHKRTIELSIFSAKGSVEKVKHRLDRYYKQRYYCPEIIQGRLQVLNDTERSLWDNLVLAPLPKLYKGRRVSVTKCFNPELFSIESVSINAYMLADIRVVNDYMLGDIWVVDTKGFTLNHALKINPLTLKKAFSLINASGIKIYAIHIINCNVATLGQVMINLLKTVISQKLLDRVQFHETLEDLYKYVPKEYLPKDYNGDMPSIADIKDQLETVMRSEKTKQFLIDCCKLVSDETKRPKEDNNEDYIKGHFRKLELD